MSSHTVFSFSDLLKHFPEPYPSEPRKSREFSPCPGQVALAAKTRSTSSDGKGVLIASCHGEFFEGKWNPAKLIVDSVPVHLKSFLDLFPSIDWNTRDKF